MAAIFFVAATLLTVLGLTNPSFATVAGTLGGYNTYPYGTSTYQGSNYPGYYGMGYNLGGWGGYGAQYPIKQTVSSVSRPVGYGGWGLNGVGYGLSYPVRSSVSTAVTRPATYGGWSGPRYSLSGLKYVWGGLRYGSPYPVGPAVNPLRPMGYGGMYAGRSGYYPMGASVGPMTNFGVGLGGLYGGYGASAAYGGHYPPMAVNFGRYH